MRLTPRAGPVVAALAVLGVTLVTGTGAWAADSPGGRPDADRAAEARLVVADMTGVLGPATTSPPRDRSRDPGDLRLELVVQNNTERTLRQLRVAVEVFAPTRTRSTLRTSLDDGEISTALLHTQHSSVSAEALAPGASARVATTVAGAETGLAGEGGVYPVRIRVLSGSRVLDEVVTATVVLADRPTGQLMTTVVWPLTAEPWRLADGSYALETGGAVAPGGRLHRLLTALDQHRATNVVLAPATHLLEDLSDRADGFVQTTADGDTREVGASAPQAQEAAAFLERLHSVADALPLDPVASPYAEVDLASMVDAPDPLPSLAGRAVAEGRRRLAALAGRSAEPSTVVVRGGLSPRALDVLSAGHLLLGYGDVRGPDVTARPSADLPPVRRSLRSASGRMLTATVADPFVTATLASPEDRHGTTVAVQRTLAESAMKFFQAPEETGRPLLILPPAAWDPPPGFAEGLLDALADAPWLRLGHHAPDADGGSRPPPPATLTPPRTRLPEGMVRRIGQVDAHLRTLEEAMPPGAEIAGREPAELADQLLRAASHWFVESASTPGNAAVPGARGGGVPGAGPRGGDAARVGAGDVSGAHQGDTSDARQGDISGARQGDGAARRSRRLLARVAAAVAETTGSVTIPAGAAVTLASEGGEVPVTVRRSSGGPVRIRVSVQSGAGLDWPQGREQGVLMLQPGASETLSFPVRAVSRGRIPVTVTVTDPSGTLELGRARLTVRSTTISRPALALVGGVVVVLLGIALVRRRSSPSRRLEVVR